MKDGVAINKVQLASVAAIIATFAEDTICYRDLVVSVETDQRMWDSRAVLCSGMLEGAAHGTNSEDQMHNGWWASPDGGCSGGDR